MIHSYDILARVEIRHEYFKNELLHSASFTPSSQTITTLRNLGLTYKTSNGLLKVLASTEKTEDDSIVLDERLNDPFQLTFFIHFNQPYWSNFTPVSADRNKVFCFYNRKEENNTSLLLHKEATASTDDLTLKFGQSHYPLKSFEVEGIQIIKTGEETNVATYALKDLNSDTFLETKSLDEGLYTITDTAGKSESLFINRDKSNAQAICHLTFDKNWGTLINEDRSWQSHTFQINFSTRNNHWRYYFPLEKINEFEGVRVLNGVRDEVFDQGQEVDVDGRSMLRFTSLSPIKMVQHGDQTFQLRRNVGISNRSEGVVVDRLPQPEKTELFRQDSQGNRYSDIYINL